MSKKHHGKSRLPLTNTAHAHASRAAGFSSQPPPFNPQKGDIILSNFSSWLDIVYAAVNFNPIFLLPVVAPSTKKPSPSASSAKPSPARRRNAGASVVTDANERGAAAAAAGTSDQNEKRLLGFEKVSLWKAIANAGNAPLVYGQDATGYQDLAQLTKNAQGPLMVFPELTTSNNRGLLRMAPIFPPSWRDLYKVTGALRMGKGQPELFVMSIKHDPPTTLTTSTTHSVPSRALNPLPHLWSLCASFSFAKGFQVRQLDPAESPTSGSYAADSAAGSSKSEDALAEAAGNLISGLARLKRTGLGWEDKEVFLDLVTGGGATKRGA